MVLDKSLLLENAIESAPCSEMSGMPHIIAAPLVQVCRVTLHRRNPADETPCDIFGEIKVYEQNLNIYPLYKREEKHRESIPPGGSLSLADSIGAVFLLESTSMNLELYSYDDSGNGAVVILDTIHFQLQYDTIGGYAQAKSKKINGKCNLYALVYYILLPAAVAADMEIELLKVDGVASTDSVHIKGSISACYIDQYCESPYDDKAYSIMFFNKPKSEVLHIGAPLELLRPTVAVPAHAILVFELNLCVDDRRIVHAISFRAYDGFIGPEVIDVEGVQIKVLVTWWRAYLPTFPRDFVDESRQITFEWSRERKDEDGHHVKLHLVTGSIGAVGRPLIEVFSVFIGRPTSARKKNEQLELFGSITIDDFTRGEECIFNKESESPEVLASDWETLALMDPPFGSFSASLPIEIMVNLKDTSGTVAIKGYIVWNDDNVCSHDESWYDRRICSIIQGANGFAALHYAIVTAAAKATITVQVCFNDPSVASFDCFGTLAVRYGGHGYSSRYAREYYRVFLFKKIQGDCECLKDGERVPLLRSTVAVPINSSLIIDADLSALSPRRLVKAVKDYEEFQITQPHGRIEGQLLSLDISVKWSGFL